MDNRQQAAGDKRADSRRPCLTLDCSGRWLIPVNANVILVKHKKCNNSGVNANVIANANVLQLAITDVSQPDSKAVWLCKLS